MIRVVLVDDEALSLSQLKNKIPWEAYQMQIVGEANNGSDALRLLAKQEVDIVFTDMRMPHMDGNAFLQRVKTLYPDIVVVVISAFDDFSHVRTAFVNGAFDYILKLDFLHGDLLGAGQSQEISILKSLKDHIVIRKSQNILFEHFEKDIAQLLPHADKGMILLETDAPNMEKKIVRCLKQRLDCHVKTIRTVTGNIFFAAMLSIKPTPDQLDGLQQSLTDVVKYAASPAFITLGSYIEREQIHDQLQTSFLRSDEMLARSYFYSANAVIRYNTALSKDILPDYSAVKEECRNCINQFDIEGLKQCFGDFVDSLRDACLTMYRFNEGVADVLTFILGQFQCFGIPNQAVFPSSRMILDTVAVFQKVTQLRAWVFEQIDILWQDLKNRGEEDWVNMAKFYIENNYTKDISLSIVASRFGVKESRLSRQFTKSVGIHFTDYVTSLRIERAKYYLRNTALYVFEVGERVGFVSTEHFSRTFKKKVGMTPLAYKESYDKLKNNS